MQLEALLRTRSPVEMLDLDIGLRLVLMMEEKEELEDQMMRHVEKGTHVQIASLDSDKKSRDVSSLPIVAAIKYMVYPNIDTLEVDTIQTLKPFISAMKIQRNTLRIYRDNRVDPAGGFSAKKFNTIGTTDFTIGTTDKQPPYVLEDITYFVSVVSALGISYGFHEVWKESGQPPLFYQVLEATAPHIEKLTFADIDAQCPSPATTNCHLLPRFNHLSHLELKGAVVDKQVLLNLSTMASHLQYLAFNT
ncbi:hypothetical protein [Parasitella parasitica]|uniref:Uncharacterized protein n=1 Tax=Parasitella parasitica TaxID=35722 RepID=A0A0B7NHU2_9FUNG|nr:hypothetical protein [Parasitella parasitica]